MSQVEKGDKILIPSDNGEFIEVKCTGVTHKDLIHYMYYKNDCPVAGVIGREYVKKINLK